MALQAGFVGCGNITDTHARAAREAGLGMAAFCGRDQAKAEVMAGRFGGRAFARYEDLLAHRPLDLVVIGSPSGLHAEQGIAAARRGLHVLVEKPIDVTTARGEQLVAAAEQAGVRLGVLFQDRLKPDLVRLRDFLASGGLGRVLLVSARVKWHRPPSYYSASRWRGTLALDGGGALVNQGIHTVDLLLWLLGEVTRVRALTATRLHAIEGEDVALALLEFASGAVGTLEATTAAFPGYPRRVEISGTEGTVVVEGDRVVAADLRTMAPALVSTGDEGAVSASTATVSDATPHQRLFEDFVRAVETGRSPACGGREGLRSLAVVEAVYAAAAEAGVEVA
ncbi:MAG TPA: Gfo/Idh/MocA family oxidoreductase [Vicinamibacteria bacterium]